MIFRIYTLFPDFFDSPLKSGLMGKAIESGVLKFDVVDIREYSDDKFKRCDDYPYGGGSGMVLQAGPIINAIKDREGGSDSLKVFATPSGKPLSQSLVKKMSQVSELSVVCGHYEGIDQRVVDEYIDEEISIGDYVLSGGEYAALVIADAVARLLPGFMSNSESLHEESFEDDLLEYPQYTRPAAYMEKKVPEVLLSGNHGEIKKWRLEKRIEKTRSVRPDLYRKYLLRKILGE